MYVTIIPSIHGFTPCLTLKKVNVVWSFCTTNNYGANAILLRGKIRSHYTDILIRLITYGGRKLLGEVFFHFRFVTEENGNG